ncbi:MAG: hypothetical protein M8861_09445 [marine benthic group bacterium]|nr:hypothetical protein [Gemmatimonadota bacterium]
MRRSPVGKLLFQRTLALTGTLVVATACASRLPAQEPEPVAQVSPPVIDTILVARATVYTEEEAARSSFFRFLNRIHVVTRERVIRDYLQFEVGEPYDSAEVAESERHLREKEIFREISIDSARLEDGRLAVTVRTQDGWSLKPKLSFSIASTGDWTGKFGLNELNLLGSGNQLYAAYVKELDRDGLNASADFDRILGPNIDFAANYAGMSDGNNGNWVIGLPFRNSESLSTYEWDALRADQNVLRYRAGNVEGSLVLDTTTYRHDAFINDINAGLATSHQTGDYLRLGATVGVRKQAFYLSPEDQEMADDSIYGTAGVWAEISKVRYQELTGFNGFGTEDIDLSPLLRFTATLAPDGLGWQGTGVGLGLEASAGQTGLKGRGWAWTSIQGNYQWGGMAQDSGRVIFNVAAGYKPAARHSTAIQLQVGRLWNQKPGDEFDLGFDNAPRGWPAHSFVGNRMWWTTIEHRYYAVDEFLGLLAVGFGAFFDYGGAWYGDQESRSGGSVGVGLRLAPSVSPVALTNRIDVAYKVGPQSTGGRWVVALGAGFAFPRRTIPTISYRAEAPR